MTFLSPWYLVGIGAAALPILLHLLKRDPEPRVKFPAVRFLKHAPVEYTERRSLRELLLLALRVAALILLAVAFARPFLTAAQTAGGNGPTIIALDTSYSMSAPGTFEQARRAARDGLDRAGSGTLVGLLTFADRAELAVKPTLDRALVRSAIDQARPGFGATRYRSAFNAAVQALPGARGTILLITDLQASGWDAGDRASVPRSARVQVLAVEGLRSNLAIVAVRAVNGRVIATVHNGGDDVREVRARLDLDGRAAGGGQATVGPRASVDLDAGEAANASIARVTVEDPDGLTADNVRYAVVDAGGRRTVLIVTTAGDPAREGFYVGRAVAAASRGQAYEPVVIAGGQVSRVAPRELSAAAAVFLLSTRGLERHGRESIVEYARSGGGVIVPAGPDLDAEIVSGLLGENRTLQVAASDARAIDGQFIAADARHPIFRSFDGDAGSLRSAAFHQIARIQGTGCPVVGRFTTGEPALLDCSVGQGHVVVIASDLDGRWNDLPIRATFVAVIQDLLRYVAVAGLQQGYLVGDDLPPGVPPHPGVITLTPPPDRPGTDVGNAGSRGSGRLVAVNVDPRESDLTRLSSEQFQSAVARLQDAAVVEASAEARQQADGRHLWIGVLALLLAVLAIEGIVAARTA